MGLLTGERREEILSHLQDLVSGEIFETWCRALDFDQVDDESVQVPVPNEFYREWVDRELRTPIEEAFRQVFGRAPTLSFTVRGEEVPALVLPAPLPPPQPKPTPKKSFAMNPEYTFPRFVIGPTNRMGHAAAVSVSENLGRFANPFFIHGGSGLGKTHLLQAICHEVVRRNPNSRIRYLSCENFVSDFVGAVRRNDVEPFRNRYRNLDVLLVDDIHFLRGKEGSQEELFHTFDALHSAGRQMIFSADAAPKQIPTLEDRLISRFEWGFVARIDPPTFEMRVAILRQRAEEAGRIIPDEVLNYIANNFQNNIRELEGAVTKILATASIRGQSIDMSLAYEALDEISVPPEQSVTAEDIIQAVAKHYGKKIADFKTRRWTKSTSLARQIAIYLTKHLTEMSLVEIGRAFGGKDHSTILYALRKIDVRRNADPDFARELERLGKSLHKGV